MANITRTPKKAGQRGPARKKAPDMDIISEYLKVGDREAVVQQAIAALGEKAQGMHFCFHKGSKDADLVRLEGYEPCLIPSENGNKQLGHKQDLLWMISDEKNFIQREGPAQLSQQALDDSLNGEDPKYPNLIKQEE